MSDQFLLQLPRHWRRAYELKEIVVNSGVARYAPGMPNAGQIAAHLEPSRVASFAGVAQVSPQAAVLLEGYKVAKGIADTAKLNKIMKLTQSVQTLTTINLAVSGITLGVVVVGFAVVIHKLNRIDHRLTALESSIGRLESSVNKLARNDSIKLISDIRIALKHSVTLVNQAEEYGWSVSLDREISRQLDIIEVMLSEVISRYLGRNGINVSLELSLCLYNTYANLLKVYLTARYRKKQSLNYTALRLQTLENFSNQLASSDLLDELYESYLTNQEHRFLESELDGILELYRYGCLNTRQIVSNHHEILKTVPRRKFRQWEKSTYNSDQPFIWIDHEI